VDLDAEVLGRLPERGVSSNGNNPGCQFPMDELRR
jgi:hypothetical protein